MGPESRGTHPYPLVASGHGNYVRLGAAWSEVQDGRPGLGSQYPAFSCSLLVYLAARCGSRLLALSSLRCSPELGSWGEEVGSKRVKALCPRGPLAPQAHGGSEAAHKALARRGRS